MLSQLIAVVAVIVPFIDGFDFLARNYFCRPFLCLLKLRIVTDMSTVLFSVTTKNKETHHKTFELL